MPIAFTFRPRKAIAAICFLASRNLPELTKGKVDKLLFLADKLHLVRYGRTVTGDWYAALEHGPIPSHIDNLLDALENEVQGYEDLEVLEARVALDRRFRYPRLVSRGIDDDFVEENLSQSDLQIMRTIVETFGHRTFAELRGYTHELPAWENAWESRGAAQSAEMRFEDFFDEDEEALPGAKEEATENSALREYFSEAAWE